MKELEVFIAICNAVIIFLTGTGLYGIIKEMRERYGAKHSKLNTLMLKTIVPAFFLATFLEVFSPFVEYWRPDIVSTIKELSLFPFFLAVYILSKWVIGFHKHMRD